MSSGNATTQLLCTLYQLVVGYLGVARETLQGKLQGVLLQVLYAASDLRTQFRLPPQYHLNTIPTPKRGY